MLRFSVPVSVRLPEVPVIVSGHCPVAAEPVAVMISELYPVVGFGENDAVTPLGRPEMDRFTAPENPYSG